MTEREAALSPKLSEVEGKLAQALETVAALERENTLLRQKTDLLVRRIFGSKSGQIDPAQLLLLLAGMDEPGKAPEPEAGSPVSQPPLVPSASSAEAPRRSKGQSPPREREPRVPAHLPVIEEVIEPAEVKAAPQQWRRIGEPFRQAQGPEPAEGEVSEPFGKLRAFGGSITSRRVSFAGARCVPSMCSAASSTPCPSSLHCRTRCLSAASRRRD